MEVFLLFVLYSFSGCVMEDVYYFVLHGKYVSKRTLLNLPLCPVYGIAMLTLWAVNGENQNLLLLFCNGFLAVSAVELSFFLISRELYDIKWWDYSKTKINLMGGVNLFYSFLWGILNIVFARVVHPVSYAWVTGISPGLKLTLSVFLAVNIFSDMQATHRELLKRKHGKDNVIEDKFLYLKGK